MALELYDAIGHGYRALRWPDARIGAAIEDALGDSRRVANVGAGGGSYEPAGRMRVAVEISREIIAQCSPQAAPALRASATALPFADGAVDASLAILTVHHWPDRLRGLREMLRVARDRAVVLTWNPAAPGFCIFGLDIAKLLGFPWSTIESTFSWLAVSLGSSAVRTASCPSVLSRDPGSGPTVA